MSKEEIVEELIKWFENYGVIIPDGSSATIKDFMVYCEIQSMAEELYEDFFADLQSQLVEKEKEIEKVLKENERLCVKYNVYTYGDKIERDKIYAVSGEALEFLINNQNQKALEQLEKVKEFFLKEHRDEEMDTDYLITKDAGEIADFLLNQINELKGDK